MEKAAAAAAEVEVRKRKNAEENSELSTSSVASKSRRLAENSASSVNSGNSTCESVNSGDALVSCCSSSKLSSLAKNSTKFTDLKQENEVTVEFFAVSAGRSVDFTFRDSHPPRRFVKPSYISRREKDSSDLQVEEAQSGGGEPAMRRDSNSRNRSMAKKMPSESELQEFFATAEKNVQKQFIDKYNYDIAKDEPMEGRYEWVPIQRKTCNMKKKKKKAHTI